MVSRDLAKAVIDQIDSLFQCHYPFFELRGIEWEEAVSRTRNRLEQLEPRFLSSSALFDVAAELLEVTADAHVTLEGSGLSFCATPPNPAIIKDMSQLNELTATSRSVRIENAEICARKKSIQIVDDMYLSGPDVDRDSALSNTLVWGWLSKEDKIAYILVSAMEYEPPYEESEEIEGELADELEEILNRCAAALSNAASLVLDLRFNDGGWDWFALQIAARLVPADTIGFEKFVPKSPKSARQTPQLLTMKPNAIPLPSSNMFVLLSLATCSAAEVCALCLHGLNNIRFIGERSQGIFSDEMVHILDNGWRLTLSNEVYTSRNGECFEGRGIPVEIEIPQFVHDEEKDPTIEWVLNSVRRTNRCS